jgi:hypothetical protein
MACFSSILRGVVWPGWHGASGSGVSAAPAGGRRRRLAADGWFLSALAVSMGIFAAAIPLAAEQGQASAPAIWLDNPRVEESSGLAFSRRTAERLWTHNDSGHGPQLYAFDLQGRATADYTLRGASSVDWEDIAAFEEDGQAWLLVADVGDNRSRRDSVSLFLLPEPDPDQAARDTEVQVGRRIDFVYPDGPRDCEAVAVDVPRRRIVLIAKARGLLAGVYELPLDAPAEGETSGPLQAERVATVPIPMVTAMDLDWEGKRIVVVNYFHGFEWVRRSDEQPWAEVLASEPRGFELPRLRQIEAVAYDRSGRIWVTSEGQPAPLVRLEAVGVDEEP